MQRELRSVDLLKRYRHTHGASLAVPMEGFGLPDLTVPLAGIAAGCPDNLFHEEETLGAGWVRIRRVRPPPAAALGVRAWGRFRLAASNQSKLPPARVCAHATKTVAAHT